MDIYRNLLSRHITSRRDASRVADDNGETYDDERTNPSLQVARARCHVLLCTHLAHASCPSHYAASPVMATTTRPTDHIGALISEHNERRAGDVRDRSIHGQVARTAHAFHFQLAGISISSLSCTLRTDWAAAHLLLTPPTARPMHALWPE